MRRSLLSLFRTVSVLSVGLVVALWCGSVRADDPGDLRVIVLEIHRAADGKRYPTPVDERYELAADGVLRYSAYFRNMPIDLNHNDSVEWKSGDLGAKVLAALAGVAPRQLDKVPADPTGSYVIGYQGADSRAISNKRGKAWGRVDPAFRAMIAGFEKSTGRPLKAHDLPQAPRRPPSRK